ncbi:MAG: NAD(P)-dependent alcohol dehydrogenase [Bacteroidales bacterium]|nr:NAD(P)-dependent alcohol dehydrogenase [Bacteroidales bacterium]
MKAIICTKYGPPEVLQLSEVEKPIPGNNEVLIKIHATSVTASDCIVRGFKLPCWNPVGLMMGLVIGFKKPRNPVLGMILAGEIESVGNDVKQFKTGDRVFGWTIKSGLQIRLGTYAQYKCLPENSVLTLIPTNVRYEEAAAIPYGGLLSWYFLKQGGFKRKTDNGSSRDQSYPKKVLIYGASGAIGTSALQIAKYFGAEVTAVCSNKNIELVKSLGADKTIDYTKEKINNSVELYDFILDAAGKKKSSKLKEQCRKALQPKGKYLSVDNGSPNSQPDDLFFLRELVEKGHLKAVIDRVYPLEEIVEAHQYVDQGHKKGNVIIKVNHDNPA